MPGIKYSVINYDLECIKATLPEREHLVTCQGRFDWEWVAYFAFKAFRTQWGKGILRLSEFGPLLIIK